jgi:excinuclease UvrABC nuclease subunit
MYMHIKKQVSRNHDKLFGKEVRMTKQNYEIKFDGYWKESKELCVPNISGIYCVYSCVLCSDKNKVSLKKIIYIGESENVKSRISNHEKQPKWEGCIEVNEVLCYSVAVVPSDCRIRCEAALINEHTPPENTEYTYNFPFDTTIIKLIGDTKFLKKKFTIYKNE